MTRIMKSELPKTAGTYMLLFYLRKAATLDVGRLGALNFKRGWYAYVGSAFGPGGLAARVGRHLKEKKKLRWHIDYLRVVAQPRQVWFNSSPHVLEHLWAQKLKEDGGYPIRRFGSSDCHCTSHLYYFSKRLKGLFIDDPNIFKLVIK